MHCAMKYLALGMVGLSLLWSHATAAQARGDGYVVSVGFGSTLSREDYWGRAAYLDLWSGVVAGRSGQWRPYASVKVPIDQLGGNNRYRHDDLFYHRERYELRAVNLGGTYSLNASLTAYIGGGWTHQRGRSRALQVEEGTQSFSRDSLNVAAGLLIHTGNYVGINAAIGVNPGTASLSANFRF